jgi:hypothetical protein
MPKAAVAISTPEERIIEHPTKTPILVSPEQVLPEATQQEQSLPAL